MTTRLQRFPRRAARPGFTILELMIVLIIIGILGAVVGLNLVGAAERAKKDATIQSMRTIQVGLKTYHARYSAYPPTEMGFQALNAENIIETAQPKDGWGNPFDYYAPGRDSAYILISYGADNREGGEPDIFRTERDSD